MSFCFVLKDNEKINNIVKSTEVNIMRKTTVKYFICDTHSR